jgi:hypothetical protein
MAKLQTVIHCYYFDTNTPAGAAAWAQFRRQRIASGARIHGPVFHTRGPGDLSSDNGATVTLDTGENHVNLFDNQWSASFPDGRAARLFDWLLEAEHPRAGAPAGIKRGHWLELTPDMVALRQNTATCGYCGHKMPTAEAPAFCPKCIGSQYLKPTELHLTRMLPVSTGFGAKRAPLTEAEQAERIPAYNEARREGMRTQEGQRLSKFRAEINAKHESKVRNATRERDGFAWLIDHDLGGIAMDNALFYSHTGRFGFGWREKLSDALAAEFMGKLSDEGFPFPYDVETVGGKRSGCVEG